MLWGQGPHLTWCYGDSFTFYFYLLHGGSITCHVGDSIGPRDALHYVEKKEYVAFVGNLVPF
jgi:hypothetical protein